MKYLICFIFLFVSYTMGFALEPPNNLRILWIVQENSIISNLQPENYKIEKIKEGMEYYLDRSYIIKDLPSSLDNCSFIKSNNDGKWNHSDNYISFTINKDSIVYILHDHRIKEKPEWLEKLNKTELKVNVTDKYLEYFNVYKGIFEGGSVVLGGNIKSEGKPGITNYIVIVKEI